MAIRKISRLQHRRGLKSDLPPKLYEGEIGFCLDTRELFIGNSDAVEGNSQILTQWTPNDRIIHHAYQGSTGVESTARMRPLGAKLDDVVSVKDYGAIGNGEADDFAAIQEAIIDRYAKMAANGFSPLSGRNTIWFPAGTYKISKPLKLYPFVKLQGEGSNRTLITISDKDARCVAETVDSAGNIELNIGIDNALLPKYIDIVDIWFNQPYPLHDGIIINRASSVKLHGVKVTGPRVYQGNLEVETNGIAINSYGLVYVPTKISLYDCEISGMGNAIYSGDPITYLQVDHSDLHDCWRGLTVRSDNGYGGPRLTRVTNSNFGRIDSHGIWCSDTDDGVISMANVFESVGITQNASPIYWDATARNCASIADRFTNTFSPGIFDGGTGTNLIVDNEKFSIPNNSPNLAGPLILLDNSASQNTGITYLILQYNNAQISYTITRGLNKRSGKLTILTNGTQAIVEDEFISLGSDIGVTFSYAIANGIIRLTYTTTNTGIDAMMYYTDVKWLA